MLIYLFNCIKKHESTMPPFDPVGSAVPYENQKFYSTWDKRDNVVLKDACSIVDPVFRLARVKYDEERTIITFNYIYAPSLGRGYWINNWLYNNGVWEADCHVDVLGSFPLPTRAQYVLRASEEFDGSIKDDFYTQTSQISTWSDSWDWPFASKISDGRFVVGIINNAGGQYGSISYYVLDQTNLNKLISQLMSDINYMNISSSEISTELQKGLINPIQYIRSCVWLPFSPNLGNAVNNIQCGWWSFEVDAYTLSAPVSQIAFTVKAFSWHPQIDRGIYTMQTPLTSVRLFALPWGLIDIPVEKINFGATLAAGKNPAIGYDVYCDCITGLATLDVVALYATSSSDTYYSSGCIATLTTQLGVPIALAQSSQDVYSAISNVVNGAVSGLQTTITAQPTTLDKLTFGTSRVIKAAVTTALGAGAGLAQSIPGLTPSISTTSTSGNFNNIGRSWQLCCTYVMLSEENKRLNGRPLCKNKILQEMQGFVRVLNPDYHSSSGTTPPTDSEIEEYNYLLSQGIYIEGITDG